MKALSVIIITYNRPDDLLVLLRNLSAQEGAAELLEEVIVINNASTADYTPVTEFAAGFPYIRYHYSNDNLGVARGRNLGISMAKAPILITIDDDAWFRDTDALRKIRDIFGNDFMQHNHAGILCFKVLYASTGQMQVNAFPHKKFDKYKHKASFLAPYFIGAGHAILKEVYEKAGDYPADFFYGMEEYDLTYRVIQNGYAIAYTADVVVLHNESPLGRTPHLAKMKMLWINKSKVAYRYLSFFHFLTTAFMWSLEFLKKTGWNWKEWLNGWKEVRRIPRTEKKQPLDGAARRYLQKVEARLWY
ncbi:glycosyltransferase family 2 protein [Chitinophaga sp. GCM10012297]|uniref:Glycosyltransferase family 2 protein n=1 Tax=Chitinophaga chungangae TaxID=2821488 RepID=A0ABS3YB23_9BACT|nr:glycosyltransferase family 2 protein [Chitinophaga chungangae]MBO9151881.1 glycosyltransferase family 2 protein [Chitinophaga chungangae]